MHYFATAAKGLEALVAAELTGLGATDVAPSRAGVGFAATLEVAYRACLWSRVASRVLLPLASFPAPTPEALYAGVRAIGWEAHVARGRTIAVDASVAGGGRPARGGEPDRGRITHSHYAALKTKDAIVDRLRERRGTRPNVDTERPDVRINLYLHGDAATVSIDLSGAAQHRRGYRSASGAAPLKETLAAAVLLLADWPRRAAAGEPLLDPMCGAGTLAVEAALIAGDRAPGLRREQVGCVGWGGHDAALWARLRGEAEDRARAVRRLPAIHGYDADLRAVRAAQANAARAGVGGRIHLERRALADAAPPGGGRAGIVVANPPYGERLGEVAALGALYAQLGDVLRRRFPGWTGYVLTGAPVLAKQIGLRPARRHVLYNGAIECRLLEFPISTAPVVGQGPGWRRRDG